MRGLDPQKLAGNLLLRNWKPGDRFCPIGSQRAHKLKELLSRRKIPAGLRKLWPVLQCGDEIAWVRSFPPAASVAVTAASRQILLIEESIDPGR